MPSTRPFYSATTICELFQRTVAEHPDEVALRASDGSMELTWSEYAARVERIAGGLVRLGVRRGDTVGLLLSNRPEFHLVDMAVLHLGATPFSIYNTSSVEQMRYLLANARNSVVVTEPQHLDKMCAAGPHLGAVVCVEGSPGFVDLDDLGVAEDPAFDFDATWRAVEPTDLATIIYTSGTTGRPKGVELEHRAVVASLRSGMQLPFLASGALGGRLISYLPDAHIANRYFGHYLSLVGGSSITTVSDLRMVAEVLPSIRPTIFLGVPAFWYRTAATIEGQLQSARGVKGVLARWAVALGRGRVAGLGGARAHDRLLQGMADRLILRHLRRRLGLDEATAVITGSAPINPVTVEYFRALGLPLCEGWAMSETAAAGAINSPGNIRSGTVGRPMDGVELRVASDGELLLKSPSLMRRYRGDAAQTTEAFDADGWYRTGDIGRIDDEGCVTIVDRKKDLIINSSGKNMAPAAIEAAVSSALPLVGSVIAVGDRRPYVVALLTLDPAALAAFATEHALDVGEPKDLSQDSRVLEAVRAGIERANQTLSRVEQIKYFHVLPDTWAPGSDQLTPTNKLRRSNILERYADEIEALYVDRVVPSSVR